MKKDTYSVLRYVLYGLFFLSFLLPVAESINYGALAAGLGIAEVFDYPSVGAVLGTLPNFVVLYLLIRGKKALNPSIWLLAGVFLIAYLGVLTWLTFPNTHSILPTFAEIEKSFRSLRYGYWVWNLSILGIFVFHLYQKALLMKAKEA